MGTCVNQFLSGDPQDPRIFNINLLYMFWCTNCNGRPCIIGPNGETSFRISEDSKRINKVVRLSSSLHLMKKATQTVNIMRPTFKNTSDRFETSRNPLTNKRGVDKKHNSYARYLARKKGKTICCCACTQLIRNSSTGGFTYAPKVGDQAIQTNTGAVGIVVSFTTGGGMANDIDTVTIRANGCENLFKQGAGSIVFWGPGTSAAEMYSFTVLTTNNCNNPSLPNSNLI